MVAWNAFCTSLSRMADPLLATPDTLPWDRLLLHLHNRQVLPVVGAGLVTVADEAGGQVPLVEWLAPRLAERLKLPEAEAMKTLNQVATAHLTRGGGRMAIYDELRVLVEEQAKGPIPPGLADLASIRDLDLFVTSTFDGHLARALQRARPGFRPSQGGELAFHPTRPVDLPEPLPPTCVYHVLGTTGTYPDFGVWEEDYMEFLCGLLEAPRDTRRNLFRELKNRSLLMIGSPFDDWVVRFFLRVAKQERLSDRKGKHQADYLAERSEMMTKPMVFYFDHVLGSPQILNMEPVAFVAELKRRWSKKYEALNDEELLASIPDEMERGSIFISYSHDDLSAALKLAMGLRAAGLPVWLDKRRLNPGGDWAVALKRAVKSRASLFLSLISEATEGDAKRFVHDERQWAAEVFVEGEIFYLPVLIGGVTQPKLEPPVFAHLHRHPLPGGHLTDDFARLLRRYVDEWNLNGEIRDV